MNSTNFVLSRVVRAAFIAAVQITREHANICVCPDLALFQNAFSLASKNELVILVI